MEDIKSDYKVSRTISIKASLLNKLMIIVTARGITLNKAIENALNAYVDYETSKE